MLKLKRVIAPESDNLWTNNFPVILIEIFLRKEMSFSTQIAEAIGIFWRFFLNKNIKYVYDRDLKWYVI